MSPHQNKPRFTLPKQLSSEPFKLNGYIPVKLPNGSIRLIHDENKTVINNKPQTIKIGTIQTINKLQSNPLVPTQNINQDLNTVSIKTPSNTASSSSGSSDFIPKFLVRLFFSWIFYRVKTQNSFGSTF